MAAFAGMYVWFQGYTMNVVEVDGIYTELAEADMLYFTAGQRYSVLLTLDGDTSNSIPFVASMDEVSSRTDKINGYLTSARNYLTLFQTI